MRDTEQGNNSHNFFKTIYGSFAGAIVAILLGFGFSALLASLGLGLVLSSGRSINDYWAVQGLNFQAIHHISIVGTGKSATLIFTWPISCWAVLPAMALMLGGYAASRMSGIRGTGRFLSGAGIAIPYVIALLVARHWCSAFSAGIQLPKIPVQGMEFDPSIFSVILKPSVIGTLLNGLVFGIIFGGIGALGPIAAIRGVFRTGGFWPPWVRGGVWGVIFGHIIFLLIFTLALVAWMPRYNSRHMDNALPAKSMVTLLPTLTAFTHYFSHGVTLSANVHSNGSTVLHYSSGLLSGTTADGETSPHRWPAFLVVLVPAISLFWAGRIAGRLSTGAGAQLTASARMAAIYALIMTALAPLTAFIISTHANVEGFGAVSSQTTVAPSAAQTFLFTFILALVFGFIGAISGRKNVDS